MCDHEPRRRRRGQPFCQRHVGQHLARVARYLEQAQRRHLGTHQRAVNRVKAQQCSCFVVATVAQHLVDKPVGQAALLASQQVNIGEGDITGHVDPAQVFIEFDAVEHLYLLTDQDQISQVQVTMALAHQTGLLARAHQGCQLLVLRLRPAAQPLESLR